MNKKKWISILLCLMLVFTCVSPVFAGTGSAWTVDDFTYDTAGTTITGLSTTGQEKIKTNPDLVLPEKGPGGEAIVALGDGVSYPAAGIFDYSDGTKNYTPASVVLPSSLKKIGKYTFAHRAATTYESSMSSMTLPEGLEEIGQAAFQFSDFTSVSIPDSVITMGTGVFAQSGKLASVKLSKNCKTIPQSAFINSNDGVAIKTLNIPEGVEVVDRSAFDGRYIESLTLPSTLKKIGQSAFGNHQLTSLVIPDKVTEIGKYAFKFDKEGKNPTLTSLVLNEALTTIGQEAFVGSKLTEVELPDSVVLSAKNKAADCIFGKKNAAATPIVIFKAAKEEQLGYNTEFANSYSHVVVFDINGCKSRTSVEDGTYTGSAIEPTVAIEGLTEGTDFTVEYKDNINSGFAKAVVSGKGNYYGSFELQFAIKAKDVNDVKDKATLEFTEVEYTGGEFQPAVSIEGLVYGQDYSVAWGDNVNPGTAKAVVTGIGNYEGTFELEFEIKAPATDDNEGGNGGNGDADLGGDDDSDKEENDDADKEDDKEIPETGDNAPLALMMALMLAAAAGGYTAYRRNYTK